MSDHEPSLEAVERQKAFLRMWLTPGLGLRGCHRILESVNNPVELADMSRKDLTHLSLQGQVAEELLSIRSLERAESEWEQARRSAVRIVDILDPAYPADLRETCDPPILLYLRGKVWHAEGPRLAIVGTRRPTTYGLQCAERLAADLAARDIVIVSGLARGIDAAAHRGALSRGSTVSVLGTGIDRIYPSENRELADSVAEKGALVSEFPLGTLPLPQNFPQRNRILAGMTLGTVVVEAADRSGSLITARLALDANREVFAVPGPIHSSKSTGPHNLIRQGACLIRQWEDVIEELPLKVQLDTRKSGRSEKTTLRTELELTDRQRLVLGALSDSEDLPIDFLLQNLPLAPPQIYSAILELELDGHIRQLPGERYVRAPTAPRLS